ncbi:hypothetical protein [Deinococcus wulumuqiensis]|uniref:hypothetical protein n=1 Tax=Deinococcus wulumuqiensis TaxID=980427 RepID=UPI00242BD08F|nr:hypothetical protein [Deinococcus wulumuqiensis]
MRPFAALPTLVTALLLLGATAQAQLYGPPAPPAPPVAPAAPVTPPVTPPSTTAAGLALGAPQDTLREYRLSETTRLRYDDVQVEVSGGTPEQAAPLQNSFREALRAREGERTLTYKQFLKVLPADGTPGRYLWNSISSEGGRSVSSRSLRTLGAAGEGSLAYQPEAAPASSDPTLALLTAQIQAELARTHAELLAGFDPASFGLLTGAAKTAPLRPGQTFTRVMTLNPAHPLATLPGQKVAGAPLQVEQQLRFESEQDGQLVFFRQARVLQPGQVVTGSADLLLTLARYVYDGELRLTPDGLPVSASRDEASVIRVTGRMNQGDLTLTFGLTVTSTSVLTLTPVK